MTPTKPPTGLFANVTAYGDVAFSRWMRRAFLLSAGYDDEDLDRPVVGIATTWSDYNTCHRDMPALTEAVRRGVLERGALPFVFPTASLHEILMAPTTMLYRNLLALETEELIRSQPMDAVVLLGGCDKTVPAQVLAATSVDVPALLLVTGPMALGSWHGERLGACTDCRRLWAASRAGRIDPAATGAVGGRLAASGGTCPVMGTASTMACLIEVLGLARTAVGGVRDPVPVVVQVGAAVVVARAVPVLRLVRAAVLAVEDAVPVSVAVVGGPPETQEGAHHRAAEALVEAEPTAHEHLHPRRQVEPHAEVELRGIRVHVARSVAPRHLRKRGDLGRGPHLERCPVKTGRPLRGGEEPRLAPQEAAHHDHRAELLAALVLQKGARPPRQGPLP